MDISEDRLKELLAEANRQGATTAIEQVFSSPRKMREVKKKFSRSLVQLRMTPFMEAFVEVLGVDFNKHGSITQLLTDSLELGLEFVSTREQKPSGNRRLVAKVDSGLHQKAAASGWSFQDLLVLGELARLTRAPQKEEAGDGGQ